MDDLAVAKAWYAQAADYRWCEDMTIENDFVSSEGELKVTLHFTYSMDYPHLELIEAIPGTRFFAARSDPHHIGYWTHDIEADIATLQAAGAEIEGRGYWPDGRGPVWAYVIPPMGCRIELVDAAARPSMEEWWATGIRGG